MSRFARLEKALPWAVAALALGHGLVRAPHGDAWRLTQWYFSYDHEFVRRGLAGSAVRLVLGDPSPTQLQAVFLAVSVTLVAALLGFAVWATRSREPALRRCFVLVLAACPATLVQFGADAGRFDHLNYLVVLAALPLLDRGRYLAVAVLAGVGTLVHEGFLLLFLPVLVAAAAYVALQRGDPVARVAPIALVGVLVFGLTEIAGDLDSMSREDFVRGVACRHGLDLDLAYSSSASLFRHLESKVLRHSARIAPNARDVLVYLGVVSVALSPYLWIAYGLAADLRRRLPAARRRVLVAVVASPLCALAMLVVGGADWSRWIACVVVESLIVALFLIHREPGWQPRFPLAYRWTLALVAASLLLGPLGELRAFPWSIDVRPFPARPPGLPDGSRGPTCGPEPGAARREPPRLAARAAPPLADYSDRLR